MIFDIYNDYDSLIIRNSLTNRVETVSMFKCYQSLQENISTAGSITNNLFSYSYIGLSGILQLTGQQFTNVYLMLMIMITGRDHFTH